MQDAEKITMPFGSLRLVSPKELFVRSFPRVDIFTKEFLKEVRDDPNPIPADQLLPLLVFFPCYSFISNGIIEYQLANGTTLTIEKYEDELRSLVLVFECEKIIDWSFK